MSNMVTEWWKVDECLRVQWWTDQMSRIFLRISKALLFLVLLVFICMIHVTRYMKFLIHDIIKKIY